VIGEQTLLQQTAARLTGADFAPAIIVSGEEQRFFVKRQLLESGADLKAILLEPAGRNTAAAACLAASWVRARGGDELLLLMPSDHVIGDREAFLKAINTGRRHAERGAIVVFGAEPTGPNTQFGYIEAAADRRFPDGAFPIACFHEKPSADKAAEYLATGRFYWNAGIFLMKASTLLDEMRKFLPANLDAITAAVAEARSDGLFVRPCAEAFTKAENISIDHGIMEKTALGVVVPVQMDWSDVGSWGAVWELGAKDSSNNVVEGKVVAVDSHNSLLRSEGRAVVAAVGLDNMAVIAVSDAIFVTPLNRSSEVKELLAKLTELDPDRVTLPAKVVRPWGSYETIAAGPRFQVKRIVVDPGERLSLQSHVHRSEHWVVVHGTAEVMVGEQVSTLQENESSFIPAGTKHRLGNPGEHPLELIEVQCGDYLGEDDIIRFEDEYGRVPKKE
jgi:mannose-1-phosphate guanylyltransferase/mannose-6-phosphate isomerase